MQDVLSRLQVLDASEQRYQQYQTDKPAFCRTLCGAGAAAGGQAPASTTIPADRAVMITPMAGTNVWKQHLGNTEFPSYLKRFEGQGIQWIWAGGSNVNASKQVGPATVALYTKIEAASPTTGRLISYCDNQQEVFLNGVRLGFMNDWSQPLSVRVSLVQGTNVVMAKVKDDEAGWGTGGFICVVHDDQGRVLAKTTDQTWFWGPADSPPHQFSSEARAAGDATYVGCFQDDAARTMVDPSGVTGQPLSWDDCKAYAMKNDYRYFGLQWPQGYGGEQAYCFVGSNKNYQRLGSAAVCDTKKDTEGHLLGGFGTNAVYQISSIAER